MVSRRAPSVRALALPRTAAWWLLSGARNFYKAWVRVTAAGTVRVTYAPARLRVRIGDIARKGWRVWIQHIGMPRVPYICSRFCDLENLPTGQVRLMVRPAASAEKPRSLTLTLKRFRKNRVALSAMHLLARKPQPAKGRWTLFGSPTVRAKPGRGGCRNARPFDGPQGAAALGRAICTRTKNRKRWVARVQPPGYLARGLATAPVVYGKNTLWAESVVTRRSPNGRVLLYVATSTGVIVERVPLLDSGRAAGLTVTKRGDVYVVGRSNREGRPGFVAVRRKRGWKVHLLRNEIRAVAAHGRGVWALGIYGLIRCVKRCRKGPQSNTALRATGLGSSG